MDSHLASGGGKKKTKLATWNRCQCFRAKEKPNPELRINHANGGALFAGIRLTQPGLIPARHRWGFGEASVSLRSFEGGQGKEGCVCVFGGHLLSGRRKGAPLIFRAEESKIWRQARAI